MPISAETTSQRRVDVGPWDPQQLPSGPQPDLSPQASQPLGHRITRVGATRVCGRTDVDVVTFHSDGM